MTYDEFNDEVKRKESKSVYLFTGPEDYLKQRALETLESQLLTPGLEQMNESIMESPQAQTIIDACETVPMMSVKRLVVVRDYSSLTASGSKADDSQTDKLTAWIDHMPDTCCLVFYMREQADMRKKLANAISKGRGVVEFDYLAENRLEKWIVTQSARRGVAFSSNCARKLIMQAGQGLTRLSGELDKLCDYAGKGASVTEKMIEELVTPTIEARIFQMIDLLMQKDLGAATSAYMNMLEAGETRIGILFMLTRQMRLMTHIKLLRQEGMPLAQIEKRLDLKHYPATRMEAQSKAFTAESLQKAYMDCVNADFNIKSGAIREQAALDRIILTLGSKE